jgi:DNA-binding transcriptional MerR regulator
MTGQPLAVLAGISYQQLLYWTRRGYLRPVGVGRHHSFSDSEVRVAVRMGALVAAGLEVSAAHDIARGDTRAVARLETALQAVLT